MGFLCLREEWVFADEREEEGGRREAEEDGAGTAWLALASILVSREMRL